MEQIKRILKLIGKHKEWIFSGIGVTIITSLLFHNNGTNLIFIMKIGNTIYRKM